MYICVCACKCRMIHTHTMYVCLLNAYRNDMTQVNVFHLQFHHQIHFGINCCVTMNTCRLCPQTLWSGSQGPFEEASVELGTKCGPITAEVAN